MPLTPRQVAEQVRKMVAGEGVVFADLFAADGVLAYPFAPPGQAPYCASKFGFEGFSESLRRELMIFGIASDMAAKQALMESKRRLP